MNATANQNPASHETTWDWINKLIQSGSDEEQAKAISVAPQHLQSLAAHYLAIRKARLLLMQKIGERQTKKCTTQI